MASRMRLLLLREREVHYLRYCTQPRDPQGDEDERPPGADDVLQLREPQIAEVVGEEKQAHDDEHDGPDEVAPVGH